MYFGSVRFFKHLIVAVFISIFLVPFIILTVFIIRCNKLEKDLSKKSEALQVMNDKMSNTSIDRFCNMFLSNNYTADDLINGLKKHNINLSDKIFKEKFNTSGSEFSYRNKYPELYATAPDKFIEKDNTVYLTFDDGPSNNTKDILNILDKYNIKATFFVVGNESDKGKQYLKEIVKRGHSIGIHSYSHDYNKIYASVDNYLDDFYLTYNYVYKNTGVKPTIFRFPGGSINTYNQTIYKQIVAEMLRRGFVYYDWNVSAEDASTSASWSSIYNNVTKAMNGKSRAVVLLHTGPTSQPTVTVLEDLIKKLKTQGYKFDKLENKDKPITFGYIN